MLEEVGRGVRVWKFLKERLRRVMVNSARMREVSRVGRERLFCWL